jgi:hypothetical protein
MEMNRCLKHLYIEELKDFYSAETQMVTGFEEHLGQTKEHVARFEKIFKAFGESPKGKKCKGEEGSEMIEEDPALEERLCQHLRQASWGRPSNLAFEADPQGRKDTDEKLTQLAGSINLEAVESGESEAASDRLRKAKTARA